MAIIFADRVKESVTGTGTGNLTLGGAVTGYQAFSSVMGTDTAEVCIEDPATGAWEVTQATISGGSLVRGTFRKSSTGSRVSFASGTKYAFIVLPADVLSTMFRATVETVSTTTHTPAIGTDGRYFRCTHASGCAVTIPPNSSQAFPVGTMLTYEQGDADSAVTFAGDTGVTLRCPAAFTAATAEQYAVVQILKVGTDEWVIYGNLAAA